MDMPTAFVDTAARPQGRLRFAIATVILQALAALFFFGDALLDAGPGPQEEAAGLNGLEVGVALALVAGIVMGAWLTRRLFLEARERERVIAIARGALAEVIADRFAEWKLSAAEIDVALFALKGCSIAEIAGLRGSAEGTVRAQLSQVYAKASVTSQSMFVALFVEDLLGG